MSLTIEPALVEAVPVEVVPQLEVVPTHGLELRPAGLPGLLPAALSGVGGALLLLDLKFHVEDSNLTSLL